MSIRDIIEKWHLYTSVVRGRDFEEMRDDFASALEELSLMEAERVAARDLIDAADEKDILRFDGTRIRYTLARKATDAYRKERGL